VAALLPIAAGILSILGTFLGLRIVNEFTSLSIYALNLVIAIGLGLAIDYSLFMVSRYREELLHRTPAEALRVTMGTAGRTVAFSSLTVGAALASLLTFPQPFLYSMGVGGILVALLSATVALVVLPAILAALGPRVNSLAPARWKQASERTARAEAHGFWYRLAQIVMRRPGPIAAGTAALLILLGIPFLGAKYTGVDPTVLPKSASANEVYRIVNTQFPPYRTSPAYIAIQAPSSDGAAVKAYADKLAALPGAAAVEGPRPVGNGYWRVDVISKAGDLDKQSLDLVRDMRRVDSSFPTYVGGDAAALVDQEESLGSHLPWAILILAATTLILLFLMTGSVILPFKTLLMNLLTISGVFGLLVLIFQDGNLESVLGYTSEGALNLTQPLLIGAVTFALATDYGVFLLTRIKEARDSGLSNDQAVAFGLERTGRIVTAAALLFCVAVGAFSTSKIVFIKEIGVGLVLGVILDATLVRALLVPSLMKLLGERNWWAPPALRRVHERFGLHEAGDVPHRPAVGHE
jgi:RND superfamily putative drug exporter